MTRDANDIAQECGPEGLRRAFDHAPTTVESDRDALDETRFKLTPFKDIVPSTGPRYLVEGLIPRIGLAVVWGPPKCGKSFWILDLALHVALGRPYRTRKVAAGIVVYIALEGEAGFRTRIAAFKREESRKEALTAEADVPFYLIGTRLSFPADCTDLISDIRGQLGDTGPVVVVIDTLNRSIEGSENKDEDMSAFIKAADAVRDAFGCAVIVVHHCGIDSTRPRGHSSLTAAADAQLAVKRDRATGFITVRVEWMKDGEEGAEITSRLERVEVSKDTDGGVVASCIVVEAAAGAKAKSRPRGNNGLALQTLEELISESGQLHPASNYVPKDIRTVPLDLWRRGFEARSINSDTKPDSKRRAFDRAAQNLQGQGFIGVWKDQVWIAGQPGQ